MLVQKIPFLVKKHTGLRTKTGIVIIALASLHSFGPTADINKAYAQEVYLSTYPSTLQLRAQPPADVRSGFTIQNKSAQTVKLNIILKPFKANPSHDGKIIYIEGNDPAIFKKLQIVDNGFAVSSIELGPKQTKNLDLKLKLDEKEQASDYYFSIVFLTPEPNPQEETTNDVSARSNVQEGIALNVLMNVGPKELPKGYLEEFLTAPFRSSGPVPFTVKIKNNGSHYFTPKGVILIRNIFGQSVGRIDLQNANILAGTGRSLIGTPYQMSAKKTSENQSVDQVQNSGESAPDLTAVWPEKFLLGIYKADLSVALSEEGPLFTQTISFVALPTNLIISLTVAAILILLISFRVRRKLRES